MKAASHCRASTQVPDALVLSLSISGRSVAMALPLSFGVQIAGRLTTLACVIGGVACGMIALALVKVSRQYAHARLTDLASLGPLDDTSELLACGTLLLTKLTTSWGRPEVAILQRAVNDRRCTDGNRPDDSPCWTSAMFCVRQMVCGFRSSCPHLNRNGLGLRRARRCRGTCRLGTGRC